METVELAKNAVSVNGGNYPGAFSFSKTATIAKERNSVQLVSTKPRVDTGALVPYMKVSWYDNEIIISSVRGGSVDLIGASIDINSKQTLTVYNNGTIVPQNYNIFDYRYFLPAGIPFPHPH